MGLPTKWLDGWQYRMLIAVRNDLLPASIPDDLPVLIFLDASNFNFDQAQPNGEDIRFVAANHTPLPYEFDIYDKGKQLARIWVRLSGVPKNRPTYFFMYWGNASATDAQDPASLWRECEGVWHFSDSTDPYRDSTGKNINPTITGSPTFDISMGPISTAALKFEKARQDELRYVYRPELALQAFSVEAFVAPGDISYRSGFIGTRYGGEYTFDMKFYNISGTKKTENNVGNGGSWLGNLTYHFTYVTGQFYHFGGRYDSTILKFFADGISRAGITPSSQPLFMKSGQELMIGRSWQYGTGIQDEHFEGWLDELRIIAKPKNDAYFMASYLAMTNQLLRYNVPEDSEPFQENLELHPEF